MNFSNFFSINPSASPQLREAYQQVLHLFATIKTHPDKWSVSIQPVAPDEAQYQAAYCGLQRLFKHNCPAPSLMLLNDGVIGSYWRQNEHYASIDFDSQDAYSWVVSNTLEATGDIWDGEALPLKLREFFTKINL
jgi:hypothetical protein